MSTNFNLCNSRNMQRKSNFTTENQNTSCFKPLPKPLETPFEALSNLKLSKRDFKVNIKLDNTCKQGARRRQRIITIQPTWDDVRCPKKWDFEAKKVQKSRKRWSSFRIPFWTNTSAKRSLIDGTFQTWKVVRTFFRSKYHAREASVQSPYPLR